MKQRCYPGTAHPNAALTIAACAKRFGVAVDQVEAWIENGLPLTDQKTIDPFICCNWLSWGPLETAPALQRLWRQFIAHFKRFVDARDEGRQLQWQREPVLYLPQMMDRCDWFIAKMQSDFSWQRHSLVSPLQSAHAEINEANSYWALQTQEQQVHATMTYEVDIKPSQSLHASDNDFQELLPIFKDVVRSFDYHYRVHELDDGPQTTRRQGTCLDAAIYASVLLQDAGFPSRICGGVIANSALLNAHHWLEVECAQGWVPFDVSIPIIARMLGEDWELWSAHYCGAMDSGRIALTRGPGYWDVPEQNFISAATGAAIVHHEDRALNAWPCIDWVCGECDGLIKRM